MILSDTQEQKNNNLWDNYKLETAISRDVKLEDMPNSSYSNPNTNMLHNMIYPVDDIYASY